MAIHTKERLYTFEVTRVLGTSGSDYILIVFNNRIRCLSLFSGQTVVRKGPLPSADDEQEEEEKDTDRFNGCIVDETLLDLPLFTNCTVSVNIRPYGDPIRRSLPEDIGHGHRPMSDHMAAAILRSSSGDNTGHDKTGFPLSIAIGANGDKIKILATNFRNVDTHDNQKNYQKAAEAPKLPNHQIVARELRVNTSDWLVDDVQHVSVAASKILLRNSSSISSLSQPRPVTLKLLVSLNRPKSEDNKHETFLTGMDFLPDGRLVAVDNSNMKGIILNGGLRRLGEPYTLKSSPQT
ncbi:hypothetical protein DPMN_132807 [Dreissena polymorpha]|uniref:Uncharacterized protein n=1 Tax=Dreissena polymorpha TaxID=45954 RepID=A0A9D4FT47_DREPO|nr:hypothetical protein DPMN_132807 [Dreissena polymorpha]